MNHKKKYSSISPLLPKGRMKKGRNKAKEVPIINSVAKDISERPPTRRNLNDVVAMEKTRNTPASKALYSKRSTRSTSGKFRTTSLASQTPREKSLSNCEQHEYLQFSLRITEEIIRNDLYKNEEMIQVLKNHYQANKARLNQDKLLKTLGDLCSELNIPMDDNVLLFLEDRGSYSRVCTADGQSTETTSPESTYSSNHGSPRRDKHQRGSIRLMISTGTETNPTLPMDEIALQPHIKIDDINNEIKTNHPYEIQVIQSPVNMEDLSKAFEFGEETLKAPGEESISGLEIKDFQVLHDATAKFLSDKDSDWSSGRLVTPVSESETKIAHDEYDFKFDGMDLMQLNKESSKSKNIKNFVVSHYSTSVEPEAAVETKEFSAQTVAEDQHSVDLPCTTFVSDATTQKSLLFCPSDDSRTMAMPPSMKNNVIVDSDMTSSIDTIRIRCQRCNCESEEQTVESSSTYLKSEGQFVLLDCPVLIPKEHSKSMDILTKRSVNFDTIGRSVHTLNMRMPPAHFVPKTAKVPEVDLHNSELYDLTPQKDNLLNPNGKFTASTGCSCVANEANTLLLSNRYDRYKKVSENLSYFYPTIATQVSSMDLLPTESPSLQPREPYRERMREDRYETERYNNKQESSVDFKPRLRTPRTPIDSANSFNLAMARNDRINLDNYRIESKHTLHNYPTGHKRHYGDEVTADREVSLVGSRHFNPDDKLDRIPYKSSTDSVEKRIITLRQDIEKYSKDDDLSQIRTHNSQMNVTSMHNNESSRRGDLLDILKQGTALLPSDVSLPRHKKMSVLRK